MSVQHGLCDFGYDPDTHAVIGTAWAAHTKAFGVNLVRTAIRTGADGSMPTALLRQSIEAYGGVGVSVQGLFDAAFRPSGLASSAHQNMPLNATGDRFTSDFIDAVTLRGEGVARQAKKSGLKEVIWWNEPNELLVKPGDRIPPGPKGGSLAPEVAAAMYWQAASRIASVGLNVSCGALSVLPQTGLNAANSYYALYLTRFYEALAAHGKHAPFPWTSWCLNMEGVWSSQSFNHAVSVLRGVMSTYGDHGSIRLTEWGWGNGAGVNVADVQTTKNAIDSSEVVSATFFQGPGQDPYRGDPRRYAGKGAFSWIQDGVVFLPEEDYSFGTALRSLYALPPIVA